MGLLQSKYVLTFRNVSVLLYLGWIYPFAVPIKLFLFLSCSSFSRKSRRTAYSMLIGIPDVIRAVLHATTFNIRRP